MATPPRAAVVLVRRFGDGYSGLVASVRIGVIGDFNAGNPTHLATNLALEHAAAHLELDAAVDWLPTDSLAGPEADSRLEPYDGLFASPGSPYASLEGALAGIRFARERGRPFAGT